MAPKGGGGTASSASSSKSSSSSSKSSSSKSSSSSAKSSSNSRSTYNSNSYSGRGNIGTSPVIFPVIVYSNPSVVWCGLGGDSSDDYCTSADSIVEISDQFYVCSDK